MMAKLSSSTASSSSSSPSARSSIITNSSTHAFDRNLKRQQRDNAARAHNLWATDCNDTNNDAVIQYDYIREEIAARLVDRLDDIRREEGFPLALDLGAGPGYIHRSICAEEALQGEGGIGGVRKLVQLDSSPLMLHRDEHIPVKGGNLCSSYRLAADEEEKFPFPDGTFDLVISSTSLHWVNDLPGVFREVRRVLKPDGCFMFAMIGGTSLPELRVSMLSAELEREGGVSPHVGPFVELSDVGNLLQGAGFSLPTLDVDTVNVSFPNAGVLMEHLQRMGESNACVKRREHLPKDTFVAAACIYDHMFSVERDEIEASFQVIYAIGWTPHESQQQPDKRGAASLKIGDVVVEKT